jgi:hypothetical protein
MIIHIKQAILKGFIKLKKKNLINLNIIYIDILIDV